MDRMVLPGRAWVACASLFLTFHVCLGSVTVKVNSKVDVMLDGTAQLPCTYTTSESSSMTVVQWFIEAAGTRKRVAYRSSADSGLDKDTPLAGRLSMEADNTLVISLVKVSDQRSFFCQVDGGAVGTSEAETKLNVFFAPEKPVVSGNNQAIPIHQNTASEVGSCTSRNGHPEPRIIWYKDSTPLPQVTDPKEKVYMVPKVVLEPSGLFTITSILYMQLNRVDAKSSFHCTVEYELPNKNIIHESSDSFKLDLLYAAENVFFTLLNQKPIKEGDEVQMKCETDGNPQPDFEFYKEDKQLDSKNEVLTLSSITRDQSGTYRCEALDFDAESTAELTKSLDIFVHYLDPVSVVPAGPLLVAKGNAVELQCKTKSYDEYTLSWMKDGKKLSQNGVLSLQSVTLADAGEYVCVASVPSVPNLQKSANVTVTVSGKPEIDEPVHGTVTKEGQKVTLKCSVLGHPTPQFTWKPSGKESLTVEGNKYISTVTLPATADVLENGVICEADNQHGAVSEKFMVTVQSDNTIDVGSNGRGSPVFATAETQQGGSSGVVIAVVVCVLLLLLLVASLYFLSKKGKMSCKKDNKQVESRKVNDNIVVEMKTGEKANEESGLLK